MAALISSFVVVFSTIGTWKYGIFAYEGIDLAYFNQVFWNTLQGRFFTQSIHPHLTLGDHAGLIIPILTPLYALRPDPRTLLFLQAIALALPAWPIYLITKWRLNKHAHSAGLFLRLTPLLLATAYLLYPATQNIAMYEFHLLPFALAPLLFALLAYDKGQKRLFLLFVILALLVREDVALVVATIGLLAWLENRGWWWRLVPLLVGASWFIASMQVIGYFAPEGSYKFMVYYSWLGSSLPEMAVNILRHPIRFLAHIISLGNLEMVLGFTMPLLFIPFLKPKRLILAVAPLLQMILGAPGGSALAVETHYATLFLPAVFLASSKAIIEVPRRFKRRRFLSVREMMGLMMTGFMLAAIYGSLMLGPMPAVFSRLISPDEDRIRKKTAEAMIAEIPKDASVMASYALLPHLSSRERLYSLHYGFLGVTQFATAPYDIPEDIRFMALDTRDLITYDAQFPNTAWAAPHVDGGFARLYDIAGSEIYNVDYFRLFDDWAPAEAAKPDHPADVAQVFGGVISLDSTATYLFDDPYNDGKILSMHLSWSAITEIEENPVMRITVRNSRGTMIIERDYPFGNGLVPAPSLTDQDLVSIVNVPLPDDAPDDLTIELNLRTQKAKLILSGIRGHELNIMETKDWGAAILPPPKTGP